MIDLIKPASKTCIAQIQAKQLPGIHILSPNLSCGHIARNMSPEDIFVHLHNTFHMVEDFDIIVDHLLMSTPTLEHILPRDPRGYFRKSGNNHYLWSAEVVEYNLQWGHFMCLGRIYGKETFKGEKSDD